MSKFDTKSTDLQIPNTPHKLSSETRAELVSLLGLDSNDPNENQNATKAIDKVEHLLGIYKPALAALKELPGPGEFVSAMNKLESRTSRLQESLSDMHNRIRGALEAGGFDLEALERDLSNLQITADLVKNSSKPTRGRPKKDVLTVIVRQLRMVFRQYYSEPITRRKTEGAIEHLSEPEQDEADFIRFALDDAKIPHDEKVRRLFDKFGTPGVDRDIFLKKFAAKTLRRRGVSLPPEDGDEK